MLFLVGDVRPLELEIHTAYIITELTRVLFDGERYMAARMCHRIAQRLEKRAARMTETGNQDKTKVGGIEL